MISGRTEFLLLTALLPWAAQAGSSAEFDAILERIDTPRGVAIAFVEKRKNPLLDEPMVLSGRVVFSDDGRLSKLVESPFRESVIISREAVELEREGRTRRLSLRRNDNLRSFYVGLRALLEGDAKTLRALFEIETSSEAECWTIVLVPRPGPLKEFLESMVISGNSGKVSRIRTIHSADDWQELSFDAGPPE